MYKLIVANLLIHVAATFALLLVAGLSAPLDMRGRRKVVTSGADKSEKGTVVELPTVLRTLKQVSRADCDDRSEAA